MSFSEYDSAFVWSCEGCGLECEFERSQQPGYFMSCVSEIKAIGWRITRDQDGEYHHHCSKCRRAESANILDMPSNRVKRNG
jgi:hypothetical protein